MKKRFNVSFQVDSLDGTATKEQLRDLVASVLLNVFVDSKSVNMTVEEVEAKEN
jgi:hypothetical protein